VPAVVAIGMWIAFQVVASLAADPAAGGVAYLAHIGGFGAGVVAGALFRMLPDRRPPLRR
jgi:membrane associated rhomboid family serine protease